ncbi:Delta-like protein 4 [Anabarilius grahami]|uniref:Delta-like protein n=1 Tax=Anabarilius grahami TaxID=495550 RepID=A0A3N0XJU9_ANAGA|nr:Delta-like protein 4 [Anabarilius grahami]
MAAWLTFLIAFFTTVLTQIFGSGVFELDLHEFKNFKGLLANGNLCKPDCRTFFKVCLKNYQVVVSPGDCIFGSAITPVLGTNSFSIMGGGSFSTPNRLPFNFGWPGSFSLIIEAWHSPYADLPVDTYNPDLQISFFAIQRKLEVGADWSHDVQIWKQTELRYSYRFICNENYYGDSCSKKCTPRDDRFGHYTCNPDGQLSCLPGWKGEYCEERAEKDGRVNFVQSVENIQPVNTAPVNSRGSATVKRAGVDCSVTKPCVNGATCMNTGQGSYTCTCQPGFTGVNCELEVRECDSSPCKNGGLCSDLDKGYVCTCLPGFEGTHCEHSLLTCADSPCFHGGRCHEKDNGRSYACDCPRGYTGLNCERRVDKCTTLPCANDGLCVVLGGVRMCSCRAGFTGQRCEININDCANNPCANGGTCYDRINDYVCSCAPGYEGRNCDRPSNACSSRPCLNGGSCVGIPGNPPACFCPSGFSGPHCEYYSVTASVAKVDPQDSFQWAAVSLAVGLVALVVLLCMVVIALRHIHRQASGERTRGEAMNNMSESQRDNLIPTSQLKNTNKQVSLEVDCAPDKSNYIHKNCHLDYNSSKEFKDIVSQEDKSHKYEKCLEEKIPLSRMYREKPECRISTICSPRDSMYQSVFVIAEERSECVIATETGEERKRQRSGPSSENRNRCPRVQPCPAIKTAAYAAPLTRFIMALLSRAPIKTTHTLIYRHKRVPAPRASASPSGLKETSRTPTKESAGAAHVALVPTDGFQWHYALQTQKE